MSKVIDLSINRGFIYISDCSYTSISADVYLLCKPMSLNIPSGTILTEQLAPSYSLTLYKKTLQEKGCYISHYNDFKNKYLQELSQNLEFENAVNRLRELVSSGKNVVLFDDCKLGIYCHLRILKSILKERGFRVIDTLGKSNFFKLSR